ncbi:hypothetical protein NN561_012373 [Cricetulus griseus]
MVTIAEGLGFRDKEREHQWHNQQNRPSGWRSGSTFRRLSPSPFGGQRSAEYWAARGGGGESAGAGAASLRSQASRGFLPRLPERRTASPLPLLKANATASLWPSPNPETDREHRLPSAVFLGSSWLVAHNSAAAETAYSFRGASGLSGLALKWLNPAARKRNSPPTTRQQQREEEGDSATHNSCGSLALPYGNWGAVSALGLHLESVVAWEM